MSDMTIKELQEKVTKFRDDRNWKQYHTPKDLAISISLEAAEILELFQWSAGDLFVEDKKPELAEELADVMSYCILMADVTGLDIAEIIEDKIQKNGRKYPVEKAYGKKEKYTEL